MLRLDVLIPTNNRAALLAGAIGSLLSARVPGGLQVKILVINNGSTDDTRLILDRITASNPGRIEVIHERRRGKSLALNIGIAASKADLIGMIDDDEEVDPQWYEEIYQAFLDPTLEFIGGPYRTQWASPPPPWLPDGYQAVIGSVDSGALAQDFGPAFDGILKGGNAVVKRQTLLRVGPYSEHLGPTGSTRLLSCEDEEMYHRLLKAGAKGRYLPSLVVRHHIATDRLTHGYFRRWCFWRGVSRGLMDRSHPMAVKYLAGIPRFLYGRAAAGLFNLAVRRTSSSPAKRFADELSCWDLAGFFFGRHIYSLLRFLPWRSRRRHPTARLQTSDGAALSGMAEEWTTSCCTDGEYGDESGGGDQASRSRVAEPRRTSAPTV